MALFNVTSNKVGLPKNAVTISSLPVSYCDPQTIAPINNIAYHNGGSRDLQLGDILYSDIGLTILYNNTGSHKVYNTLDDPLGFIELTPSGVYRVPVCQETNIDEMFKINSSDTTTGFFLNKILAGTGISFVLGNSGANETITINSTVPQGGVDTNWYPTSFNWNTGSTSGPTGSLTGIGMTGVSYPAIPSASTIGSGVVTTTNQTFAGVKTFNNKVYLDNIQLRTGAPSLNLIRTNGTPFFSMDDFTGDISTAYSLTANSFIKVGGTSLQYLMADGSVSTGGGNGSTGTVTSVASGNGMNFPTITTTGSVTLGLPSSINVNSTNSVTATSHSHAWTASMFDLSNVLETTLVGKAGKFLTVNTAETGFVYGGDGFVPYTGAIYNVDLNTKQLTNLSYLGIARSSTISSGTDTGSYLNYTTSHSGTSGFDLFKINQTGTVGSGQKNLINLQVSGTSKFRVDTLGNFHNMIGTRSNNINDTTYFDDTIYLKNGGLITNESASGSVVIAANGITTISTIGVDNDSILLTAASTNNGPAWTASDTKYGVVVGRMWANTTDVDTLTATSVQMYFNETVNHSSHGPNSTHYTLRLNPTIVNAGLKHYAIHSATGDVVFGNAIVTTPNTTVPQIYAASIKTLITREYGDTYYLGVGGNTFHTTWTWSNGTASGPTASITGSAAAIPVGAIPSASATVSGVITTGVQTIAGSKTFSSSVTSPDFIGTSDRTLKENIIDLPPTKLKSVYKTFNFKGDTQLRVGVIAQELELYHPEFVRTNEDGFKAVSYNDLHSAEIAYLKSRIEQLEEWVLNNK